MISAIVLAAGEGKRMGQPKQLLEWRGKIVLQHVLDMLQASKVEERILVLGHGADRVLEKISPGKTKIVINPEYKEGMSTSLRRGLGALDEKVRGFFIVLGDQPGIGPGVVNRMIQDFRAIYPRKNIFFPTYQGCRGNPVLFSTKYLGEARKIRGDGGGRQILAGHPEDSQAVEVDTRAILLDIDTPEDYRDFCGAPSL
jgi:molybdenum cofactor cytidylyltransferase